MSSNVCPTVWNPKRIHSPLCKTKEISRFFTSEKPEPLKLCEVCLRKTTATDGTTRHLNVLFWMENQWTVRLFFSSAVLRVGLLLSRTASWRRPLTCFWPWGVLLQHHASLIWLKPRRALQLARSRHVIINCRCRLLSAVYHGWGELTSLSCCTCTEGHWCRR